MFGTVTPGLLAVVGVFVLAYFLLLNGTHLVLTLLGIGQTYTQRNYETYEPANLVGSNQFLPGIAVVVPAYNEADVIVESVQSLLSLDYRSYETIVVNDGSEDGTLCRLIERYGLRRVEASVPHDLDCEPVRAVYRAPDHDLVVIDKDNGGKSDALNAALNFTDRPLFCAVDADSRIERDALEAVAEPFIRDPRTTIATGGTVRILNELSFSNGRPADVRLPANRLVRLQVVEYLRAFFIGRTGLDRIGSLLIISGAFGLFRTDALRAVDGYDTTSDTEDMEVVVRLHRHFIEQGQEYEMTFLSYPVVWTMAPTSVSDLASQRRRWFRGLVDTLVKHRDVIFRPSYGTIGLVALPLFLAVETLGRLVEAVGYLLFVVGFLAGLFGGHAVFAFLLVSLGLGSVLTTTAVLGEVLTYRQYDHPRDVATLLAYAILENLLYVPWRAFVSWHGLYEYLKARIAGAEISW